MVPIPSFLGLCKKPTLKCGPPSFHTLDSRNLPRIFVRIIFCKEAKSGAEDTENQCHDTRIQFMLWYFSPCNKMSEMATPIPTLSTWQVIMVWNYVLLPVPDSICLVPISFSPHHPDLELEFVLSNHQIFKFANQNWRVLKKILLQGSLAFEIVLQIMKRSSS